VTQLFKFLMVGTLNTAIQYAVFSVLYGIVSVNYLIASTIGYCFGMANSYLLNRRWTFASDDPRILGEFTRFTAVNLAALGTNTGLVFLLVAIQHTRPPIAQLWAIVGSIAVNFLLNKFWTFSRNVKEG
jgi:putative flippase GtrA